MTHSMMVDGITLWYGECEWARCSFMTVGSTEEKVKRQLWKAVKAYCDKTSDAYPGGGVRHEFFDYVGASFYTVVTGISYCDGTVYPPVPGQGIAPEFKNDADKLRHRLKVLLYLGDCAVSHECWKDTDAHLIEEYGSWLADEFSDLDTQGHPF